LHLAILSIPSKGSIQFLLQSRDGIVPHLERLNPLKRVNSILTQPAQSLSETRELQQSQSPQTGQFNSYKNYLSLCPFFRPLRSQSPQTGQFNSYNKSYDYYEMLSASQSPQTGQFNSYKNYLSLCPFFRPLRSQSPQTGQFNSYTDGILCSYICSKDRLNPLKRVNSILTNYYHLAFGRQKSLNPLKRVNSILTRNKSKLEQAKTTSQSPQTGQFNSYLILNRRRLMITPVSIPSNGSILFLHRINFTP